MKTKNRGILLSLALVQPILAQNYQNVIEMVEFGRSGQQPLLWTMPGNVAEKGTDYLVKQAVPENGALFILSTIQDSPFKDWQLDQAAVGAYLPKAVTTITTHDPDSPVLRTRADMPYKVSVEVSGLYDATTSFVDAALVQQAAKKVYLEFYSQDYPSNSNSLPGGILTNPFYSQIPLTGNGTHPSAGPMTVYSNLNPAQPDKARGEEHVLVQSLPDGTYSGDTLSQDKIQVWPVWHPETEGLTSTQFTSYSYNGPAADMKFQQLYPVEVTEPLTILPGETAYDGAPPEFTFRWVDLYPSSAVMIVVNDAAKPYPWGGRIVPGTEKMFNEEGSFNHEITIESNEWGDVFQNGDGRYTIWMITSTPGIGYEVGGNYSGGTLISGGWTIPIKQKDIQVRAGLHSLDS